MKLTLNAWANGQPIPANFAFGQIPDEGHFELAQNINNNYIHTGVYAYS